MSMLAKLFGLEGASEAGLHLAKIMAILLPAFAASFQISTTFWMIFMAESLGGGNYLAGITMVGILVVVELAIQTALDYPTGAIGDWIGQRWVIASAMICYSAAFMLASQITYSTPFSVFLAIYALMGLGASQESGAFSAWFDNNYRIAMPHDTDRKQYGVFSGRLGMLFQVVSTLVLIPGSLLALLMQRTWVFQLQAYMMIFLAVIVLFVIRDLPGVRDVKEKRPTLREYGGLLKDGVLFTVSSPFVAFTFFGEVLMWATGTIWWNLLLFPLYFSYLLTDIAVSGFRTSVFLPQAVTLERSGIWSRRFDPVKWIHRFRLLQFCGFLFYLVIALSTLFFPPPVTVTIITFYFPFTFIPIFQIPIESIIPIILIFIIFLITSLFESFSNILTQRVMIDVFPTRIRNSLYSFKPTVAMLFAIPLLIFFGWLLPLYGFPLTFGLCSLISLLGAILIRKGFSYPIPKAKDLPTIHEEAVEAIPEKVPEF
ncbi:MAG: hypothetical protein ACFFDP_08440 [Promethearchaeota archaeon]